MKQRTASHQNAPDEMARQITEAVLAGDPNVLHIIPSTSGTLIAAADWAREAQWRVVGLQEHFGPWYPDVFELLTPAQFLTICRDVAADEARRPTVIFTDQFVSAEHAPLLVRQGAEEMFYPSLEVLAVAQYGFAVSYWKGTSFATVVYSLPKDQTGVLRLLRQYYEACDTLSEVWLMRERQYQRTLPGRIEAAKHRIRFYQSIAMLSATDDASVQAQVPLLEELTALHQQLPKSAAT